jgi:FAD/FMN-containing dehydrogenase
MSYNRRTGYDVQEATPPLTPMLRLLDCETSTATRGTPAHDPTVPIKGDGHGSVSRRVGTTDGMVKSGSAVTAAADERRQQSSRMQARVPS